MNVNLGIWDKLSKLMIGLLLLAAAGVLAGVFLRYYLPLIQKNQRYRKEIISLDAKIVDQERFGKQLKGSIDSLQNDPRTVERLAREKLSLARTNEMVVRFEPPEKR